MRNGRGYAEGRGTLNSFVRTPESGLVSGQGWVLKRGVRREGRGARAACRGRRVGRWRVQPKALREGGVRGLILRVP